MRSARWDSRWCSASFGTIRCAAGCGPRASLLSPYTGCGGYAHRWSCWLDRKQVGSYVVSLPERLLRSLSALSAGAAKELGEVVLPARVRRSKLYDSLVES